MGIFGCTIANKPVHLLMLSLLFLGILVAHGSAVSEEPALTYSVPNETIPSGTIVVYFFYNQHCGDCQKAIPYIEEVAREQPDVQVRAFDIFDNATNEELFQEMSERYGHPFSLVPSVFVGDRQITGYDEIKANLSDAIEAEREHPTGTIPPSPVVTPIEEHISSQLTIPLIISAALIDGINPCAFSVLIFLLISLIALDSRRKMLLVGTIYIIAVFIFYFLSGLGIFAIVQVSGISRIFSVIAASLAILFGLITIRDAFFGDKGAFLAIPESRKGVIDTYVRKGSLPAAFVLGILVGMFELPCTGGIYLAILSLLSHQGTITAGLPYLLLYNVIFVLPLVAILIIISYGIPPERLNRWRLEHRKMVRLIMGAVMIGIGAFIIAELFF
jgi:cytochrome c biogenesis protein CcdA/glutaredoxin